MTLLLLRISSSLRSAQLVLLIAIPTAFLLLPLSPPFRLACGVLALLSFFPVLRSLHLLLALDSWTTLLAWSRTLDILLPGTSLLRRSLPCPLLIVLPHYGVTRLVTVTLLLKFLLLLHLSGIAIP